MPIEDCTIQPGQPSPTGLKDTERLYTKLTEEPGATVAELPPPLIETFE